MAEIEAICAKLHHNHSAPAAFKDTVPVWGEEKDGGGGSRKRKRKTTAPRSLWYHPDNNRGGVPHKLPRLPGNNETALDLTVARRPPTPLKQTEEDDEEEEDEEDQPISCCDTDDSHQLTLPSFLQGSYSVGKDFDALGNMDAAAAAAAAIFSPGETRIVNGLPTFLFSGPEDHGTIQTPPKPHRIPDHLLSSKDSISSVSGIEVMDESIRRYASYDECKQEHCQRELLRDHFHCLQCKKTIIRREEMIRHSKWHKKREESLQYNFMRFSPNDDCKEFNCGYNGRQTHYHCLQLGCNKVYISTSDVQMHSNFHKKDAAINQEGFQRYRATELCGAPFCPYNNQRTTHFHCMRPSCRFTFKNKADMDKHKSHHQKNDSLSREGFKKFIKYEHCDFAGCKFSKVMNHIHCIRDNCDYVVHSSAQINSHRRKHDRRVMTTTAVVTTAASGGNVGKTTDFSSVLNLSRTAVSCEDNEDEEEDKREGNELLVGLQKDLSTSTGSWSRAQMEDLVEARFFLADTHCGGCLGPREHRHCRWPTCRSAVALGGLVSHASSHNPRLASLLANATAPVAAIHSESAQEDVYHFSGLDGPTEAAAADLRFEDSVGVDLRRAGAIQAGERRRGRPPKNRQSVEIPRLELSEAEIDEEEGITELTRDHFVLGGGTALIRCGFKMYLTGGDSCCDELCQFAAVVNQQQQREHYHCVRPRCHHATDCLAAVNLHRREFHHYMRIEPGYEYFDRAVDCRRAHCSHRRAHNHYHCVRALCDYGFKRFNTMHQHTRKHHQSQHPQHQQQQHQQQQEVDDQAQPGTGSMTAFHDTLKTLLSAAAAAAVASRGHPPLYPHPHPLHPLQQQQQQHVPPPPPPLGLSVYLSGLLKGAPDMIGRPRLTLD